MHWPTLITSALATLALLFLIYIGYRLALDDVESADDSILSELFARGDIDYEFLNDEEALLNLAHEYDFTLVSPEEQTAFLKGEEFTRHNPPSANSRGKFFTSETDLLIKERGVNAFEFEQETDYLNPRYIVEDRTEINFVNNDEPYSTVTAVMNLPLPVKLRTPDTIYFEVKVFEFNPDDDNSHFAIGLVTKPYPSNFRLPGYNNFSLAYESTGNLKINKPFPTPLQQHKGSRSLFNAQVLPSVHESDVVGFGLVISSGTVFITRNGKKLMDVMKGCHLDLFPALGCFSTNAKFQVNIGQMGFLWIEANVRRYGFFSTGDRKIRGDRGLASLPEYGSSNSRGGKLLEKGEDLPPDYPEDEVDFFGRIQIGSSAMLSQDVSKESSQFEDKY